MLALIRKHNVRKLQKYLFVVVILFVFGIQGWGQTSPINESFSNLGPYGGYQTETWTGDDGGTWTATDARTDQTINGKAICIRNGELTSPTVSGGIGSLTVTTQRAYAGGSGDMDVRVNGTSVGSIPYDGTEQTTTINNINVSGDVVIVIDATNSSSDRPKLDDLSWTAYTAGPTITLSESSLTGFSYEEGNGPSAEQTFTVEGSNLTDDITLTAPTNYEISETSGNGFGSSITLTQSGGSVTTTTIYVRLKSSLSIGTYNNEIITASSTDATDQTVTCDGEVVCPSVSAPTATAATSASGTSFTANWDPVSGATGYELDVYSGGSPMSDLIISEYIEGSSNNKYLEIYNGTGGDIDLTDYSVNLYANGATSPSNTEDLSGTLADGATLVLENSSATIYSGTATSSAVCNFNGNDAISLEKSGTNIDVIGTIGDDSEFASDITLIRKSSMASPTDTYDSGEWDSYAQDYEELGTHTYSGGTSYILQNEDVGNVTSYDVTGLTAGETYYYVVRAYNDCGSESSNSNEIEVNLSCTAPTTEASDLTFPNTQYDQMDVSWTNGDGDYRLVVASTSPITGIPSDNTSYTADAVFNNGQDELNAGEYIMYAGSGNSFTMTGLNSDTQYYIKIFEFNCDSGNEQYLTGSPLSGDETTVASIPAVTGLDVSCTTETTATVEWTNPSSGDWSGVIIAIRNSTNSVHTLSDDPSTVSADAVFGNGHEFGTTTPYSYVVYKGPGTSVTITGLTQGQDYSLKAISFYGSLIGEETTTTISDLDIENVSSLVSSSGDGQIGLTWANPQLCYDEILVVGHEGGAVTSDPSGDGSAYTADAVFGNGTEIGTGNYVVYKGNLTTIDVTGLTNGIEYCFNVYSRVGSEWADGVEVCAIPQVTTDFQPGDLAIVAVNTQAESSGSDDEICFFTFMPIIQGTSIDFTDNGYERVTAGLWGDTEGTIRLTRTGSDIPAGQVICFQGAGYDEDDFDIYTCGTLDNGGWEVSSLNGGYSYDLNSDDQIWIMQGGAWDFNSSHGDHDAYYDGNVLYGWTATSWKNAPGYSDTKGSTIFPGLECFNTNVEVTTNHDKVKYVGSLDEASQFEWITRVNNDANWKGYADNTDYNNETGYDYSGTCITFPISELIAEDSEGVWSGVKNEDWFDCENWENLRIPIETIDVSVSGNLDNHITIDDGIVSVPEAECNDLTIASDAQVSGNDFILKVNHTDAVLNIHGNMENNQTIEQTNGEIHYKGDFTNNDTYTHNTSGKAVFDGDILQNLTGLVSFYNLEMNNSSDGLTLNNDINVTNNLILNNATINTGTNKVHVQNTATGAISGYSTASYINGNVRRDITGAGLFDFPVGNDTYYELASLDITSANSLSYIDAFFESSDLGAIDISGLNLMIDGTLLTSVLDAGYWQVEPDAGLTSIDYDIILNETGATNAASVPEQHAVIKRDDAVSDWHLDGTHDNATQAINGSVVTARISSLSGFSQFAIARSKQWPLAIELMDFNIACHPDGLLAEWITASEENSDYFCIQHSSDGNAWKTIEEIFAFGTTNIQQNYQVVLKNAPAHGYYRLTEVDMDGTATDYSPEYINCDQEIGEAAFLLYPNPASSYTQITSSSSNADYYKIHIVDTHGKNIKTINWENPDESALKINTENLGAGMYILRLLNESEMHHLQLNVK